MKKDATNTAANDNVRVTTTTITIPSDLGALYSLTDAKRFPGAQLAEGLERESTLFWADFSVADRFGLSAINDTFKRCYYKTRGYKVVTEFAVVLNNKIWQWHDLAEREENEVKRAYCEKVQDLYNRFFQEVVGFVDSSFSEKEAEFYYRITD